MATINLITLTDPRSPVAEAFRTLRTNLMFSRAEHPLQTILVTAAEECKNKSTILANLAVTFAQSGHRTILVDGDLRRPTLHTIWGNDNRAGLTTMMSESAAMATPPLLPTGVENLSLLTAGPLPAIPADVLSSQRMNEIIGVLKARADYVLFDSPPVLAASDAVLLGSKLDGVLLVVNAGHTRRDHVQRAQQALARVNANLIGAVLTNAQREGIRGYFG